MILNMRDLLKDIMDEETLEAAFPHEKKMSFKLKPGQRKYLNWTYGRTMYCYTPHPDENGDFWCFNYVRTWKSNRKPKAGSLESTWEMRKAVRCAKRSTAKRKAYNRYQRAVQASKKAQ